MTDIATTPPTVDDIDAAPHHVNSYGEDWHLMEGSSPAVIQSWRTGEIRELRRGDVLPDGTTWPPEQGGDDRG